MAKIKISSKSFERQASLLSGQQWFGMFLRSKIFTVSMLIFVIFVSIMQIHFRRNSNNVLKVVKELKSDNLVVSLHLSHHSHDCKGTTSIDPYNKEIAGIMSDFGDLKCNSMDEISVTYHMNNNTLTVAGFNIDSVTSKVIWKDKDNNTQLGDPIQLVAPKVNPNIKPGSFAGIRNLASSRCIVPKEYNAKHPPDEIFLEFSDKCDDINTLFEYTKEGRFKHNVTGKCFGPKSRVKFANDVPLVLTNNCSATFSIIKDGVIQHSSSKYCIHPLWGGKMPAKGQKLCFYNGCDEEKRLQYRNFIDMKFLNTQKTVENVKVTGELNMIEISTINQKTYNTFISSVHKKPLKHIDSKKKESPNVFIITLDHVSAAHFMRKLPKSNAYLFDKMKADKYESYASVTEATRENVYVMLNGIHPSDKNASASSIFALSRKNGYASFFVADYPYEGFDGIDSDHNGVPLYTAIKRKYDVTAHNYCLLTQPFHELMFGYLNSFLKSYEDAPKLAMMMLSEMTLKNYNTIGYIDTTLEALLTQLHGMKNTIVIVNSLKGSLAGKLKNLQQGVEEYRRPLLHIYMSNDLNGKFKLEDNRKKQLSSTYDLYTSISEFVSGTKVANKYGKSLTEKIPDRDCLACGVVNTMCFC